ncbi:Probable branched-chain amino acid transport ATP-binding protein LivG, partial [Geodia barretti]
AYRRFQYFGGLAAVNNVDFAVYRGEIVGLIGPNGSGKTTLFDCLSRLQKIDSGKVVFKGRDVTRARPYQVARMGLTRTFQSVRVYRKMTVLRNMLISHQWRDTSPCQHARRAHQLLDFLQIGHLADEEAGHLSGGQRRLLEIGMALMPDPDILLLDEATSGVNPTLIETIKDRIRTLNAQGKTFLLIEHNINFIADLCSRVYVLNYGEKLAEGTPQEILQNEA